jgi:hypothetical protein
MTAKKIVLFWISNQIKNRSKAFYSFDFENQIGNYGRLAHRKVHTPSTYSRVFRAIRSSDDLERMGLRLTEIDSKGNAKGWKIEKLS